MTRGNFEHNLIYLLMGSLSQPWRNNWLGHGQKEGYWLKRLYAKLEKNVSFNTSC
jgi:hypothetical protein